MFKKRMDEKKRQEQLRIKQEKKAKRAKMAAVISTVGLVTGAAGAVVGMLFAPKAGKETREALKEKTEQLKTRFKKEDTVETFYDSTEADDDDDDVVVAFQSTTVAEERL